MQQILIVGTLLRQARTFDLAVTYLHEGTEYTQLIGPSGQPFRITPSICPERRLRRLWRRTTSADRTVNGYIDLETVSSETAEPAGLLLAGHHRRRRAGDLVGRLRAAARRRRGTPSSRTTGG
ncbi:hypothetical protein [Actinoplanes sp. URMC 104]|uniref:hypothetical protein n=1 Tax=Actinoplanes sp. URMC 104 TaxID=3423409 RepID=UPI003F1CA5F8